MNTKTNKPEPGKVYRLTGGPGSASIANGDSWADSVVDEKAEIQATASEIAANYINGNISDAYHALYERMTPEKRCALVCSVLAELRGYGNDTEEADRFADLLHRRAEV